MINLKQLLTENTVASKPQLTEADHVHNGLHKVFGAGDPEISVNRCENVGLGYIKNISEAFKVAKNEALKVAKIYGYRLDEDQAKFVKENANDFSKLDAQNPTSALAKMTPDEHPDAAKPAQEEKSEVQIGNEILNIIEEGLQFDLHPAHAKDVIRIKELAEKLLQMHGAPLPTTHRYAELMP
jgi:hypothetical protein